MAIANRKIGYDEVQPRDLHFNLTKASVSRYWLNGDPWTTHWMNTILAAVPDGERFVMRCVARNIRNIESEMVRTAARDFVKQEHFHAREHDTLNQAILAHGIPLDVVEKNFQKLRAFLEDYTSPEMQLSMMAAFEHFTSMISAVFHENKNILKNSDIEVARMLTWHMIEETEHKSVTYDVYQDTVGSYTIRVAGIAIATVVGVAFLLSHRLYLVKKDNQLLNWQSALKLTKFLWVNPGLIVSLLRHYLAYYMPDFHPWDYDNRAQLAAWKNAFAETGDPARAYEAYLTAGQNAQQPTALSPLSQLAVS